jgi:hypothetical protein
MKRRQEVMNKQDQREADKQTESLSDLPVADEQANQTKAGAFDSQGRLLVGTEGGIWR